ncbi:MAG: hypothetical protein E7331_04660 [Clostridiales bacterium]|nr:hypothetical protein [Clostridiales bacterium]
MKQSSKPAGIQKRTHYHRQKVIQLQSIFHAQQGKNNKPSPGYQQRNYICCRSCLSKYQPYIQQKTQQKSYGKRSKKYAGLLCGFKKQLHFSL